MFARISCPACSHKFSVPEAAMGKRQSCPNCQSYFVAGKSNIEPAEPVPMSAAGAPAPAGGFNKTMMADTSPAIRFNCPRCKKPIEVAASEAGTKMACPGCSQRLQVPAAPAPAPTPAAAPTPAINKTMLVDSGPPIRYNCPACKKPLEAGSSEALTKKPCPSCGQRHQVPAPAAASKPNINKTMLATESGSAGFPSSDAGTYTQTPAAQGRVPETSNRNLMYVIGGFVALLVLVMVVPAVLKGGSRVDEEKVAENMRLFEKLKADQSAREAQFAEIKKSQEETQRKLESLDNKYRQLQNDTEKTITNLIRSATDEKQRRILQDELDDAKRKLAEERRLAELEQKRLLLENETKLNESKKALEDARNAAQKQQTIIQQPPPVIYYPPYHPRYYYWW